MLEKVSLSKKAIRLHPFLEKIVSFAYSAVGAASLVSLLSFFLSAYWKRRRDRTLKILQARAKEQFEKLLREIAHTPLEENLLGSVLSTSTAQSPAGVAEGSAALDELRTQISVIEQKIQTHRNEIVEVSKVDPVLEATIKASIENLTKRIEFLEKTRLEKWDVAIIVFQVFSGLGVIFGIIFAIIKYLHP